MICQCGKREAHEIASRVTADGVSIVLWSDGALTGRMGIVSFGAAPRNPGMAASFLAAGWLAIGEVPLYGQGEIRDLVRAARRAVAQASFPPIQYLRRRMAGERFRASRGVVRAVCS